MILCLKYFLNFLKKPLKYISLVLEPSVFSLFFKNVLFILHHKLYTYKRMLLYQKVYFLVYIFSENLEYSFVYKRCS